MKYSLSDMTKQKSAKLDTNVNMEELIGNTHDFAESGCVNTKYLYVL